jgi:hypothetical protein
MVDKLKYVIIEFDGKVYVGISRVREKHPAIANALRREYNLHNMTPIRSAGFLARNYDAFFDDGPTWHATGYSTMLDIGAHSNDFDTIVEFIGNPEEYYNKLDMDDELMDLYEDSI